MDKEVGRLLKKEYKRLMKEAKRVEGLLARVGGEVKRRKRRKGKSKGGGKGKAASTAPPARKIKTKTKGKGEQLSMFSQGTVTSTKAERAAALRSQQRADGDDSE
jgi:hypothetical protein